MSIRPAWALALAASLALPAFAAEGDKAAPAADNPFFQPSTLPYQFPPFDRITDAHYLPAFERGMARAARRVRCHRQRPGGADLREHHRRR